MPKLPSGQEFAIARTALFDHGGNWFDCPEGHFWYWVPDPEINPPPCDPDGEILQAAEHAPVPKTRDEVKKFIQVLERLPDGNFGWRGEWLADFPKYTKLDEGDLAAWQEWIDQPDMERFLDETIERCRDLAKASSAATGFAVFKPNSE